MVRVLTCQPHSHRGNQSWHSHSPSAQTCPFHPFRDAEQERHTPVPAIFQGHVEFGAATLKERGRADEEDKVHPDLFVVAPERPAIDKLLAKEVLVPNIKAAEDLNLRPFHTTPAALLACSLLHTPH